MSHRTAEKGAHARVVNVYIILSVYNIYFINFFVIVLLGLPSYF